MCKWLIQIASLLAFATFAFHAEAEALHLREIDHHSLNESISVFEDASGELTITEILDHDRKGSFVERKDLHKNGFGFTKSAIWVKARVFNDTDKSTWIVGSPRPDFSTMDVVVIDEKGSVVEQLSLGSKDDRDLKTRLPAGRLHLAPGQTYSIYMKVQSPLQLSLSFHLLDEDDFMSFHMKESNFFAAYFGTVIALIIYNLFLFIFLRYRDYVFYVIFGLAMALNAYVQGGFAEHASFHLPFLKSTADAYKIILFPSIASMLYTRSFLRLRTIAPRLNRAMGILAGVGGVIAIFLWTEGSFAYRQYVTVFDGLAVALVFLGSVIAIRAGDRTAKVFLFAWGLFAACVTIWLLGNMGWLEKNFLVAISALVGNMCEMVLMSIALALRIKEMDRQKLKAEMKARERDNLQHLLRMVCHDISNPLSIIKTVYFLSARRVTTSSDESKQWERIKRASDSIESIINQVRKYEAFRSGKLAFEMKPTSLRKIFEDVDFFFMARAQEKDINLTCEVMGPDDIMVMADGISLTHEIINNLVSNAIKFTLPNGFVRVEAKLANGFAYLTVRDNGIGIPEGDIAKIFESSGRSSRPGTAKEVGTGFGMPLVKTFLEMFGGEITVSSKEKRHDQDDHGTTITIKLNLAPQESIP